MAAENYRNIILGVFLLLGPELAALALFIDFVSLDVFLLLIEVQIVAMRGYYFHTWFKPILMPIYRLLLNCDPYFFIPTRALVNKYPMVLCHTVPSLILSIICATVAKPIIDMSDIY
jgi:hypothetical protein